MIEESGELLKILIADDSNSDRLLLKAIVQNQGHQPLLAADGAEAIEIFNTHHPDIILLDALMPNVDGFETARYVKSHSGDHFVPIIFLTSLNEADSLAQCLEAGGDDFLTKPYNSVILKAKINAFLRMLKMHVTLEKQRDVIADNHRRLLQEQEVAKRTFDKIAHKGTLNASNIKYTMSPIAVFNGDVLLASVRPNGNLCVILGDFTGHGLAAAIGAMPLSQAFYSMVAKGFSVRDIVIEINRKLKELLPVGVFCCATVVDVDFRNKTIEVWNGGMPDSYLFHADEKVFLSIPSSHLPLGILPHDQFRAMTDIYPMSNGDRFFIWSDGILEASNDKGEMFGEERIKSIFASNANADLLYGELTSVVNHFIGNSDRSDDLSIVEIRMVNQLGLEARARNPVQEIDPDPEDWRFTYEVRPISLRTVDPLPVLQKMLMDLPGLRPRSGELFTVLSELYANALEHGLLGLESGIKKTSAGFAEYYKQRVQRLAGLREGFVRFELEYKAERHGSQLRLLVIDSGKGFDYKGKQFSDSQQANYSGRGLHLVHSLCSSVRYLGDGNQIEVVFDWSV